MKISAALLFGAFLVLMDFSLSPLTHAQAKPKYEAPKPKEQPKKEEPKPKPKYEAPKPKEQPKKEEPKPKEQPKKEEPKPKEQPKKEEPKSKYSSGNISTSVNKPISESEKARAAREARSERTFVATQKAITPPKTSYTTNDGKQVDVRIGSKQSEQIRNKPSASYTPNARQQTTRDHIVEHHYHHPSYWYHTQPTVYVGGGYSSAFWYMMQEWDAQRRADWLYHNRYHIDQSAYERGLRDAEVLRRITELENKRIYRNGDYVDTEFKKDPSIMYDQEYIEAVYNPTIQEIDTEAALAFLLWTGGIVFAGIACFGVYYLIFKMRINA
jgi:hypothetical protein